MSRRRVYPAEALGYCALTLIAGVAIGSIWLAPAQTQARVATYGPDSTLHVPSRQTTLVGARHACEDAGRTMRALVERLQEPEIRYLPEPEEADDARRRAQD